MTETHGEVPEVHRVAVASQDLAGLEVVEERVLLGPGGIGPEAAEDLEDQVVKVNNIVSSFRLQSTSFDKKSFLVYLKGM